MSLAHLLQSLGLTVLHMLWIGALIGAVVFVWLRSNPAADPRTRYACAVGGVIALLIGTGSTFAFLASTSGVPTTLQTGAAVAWTADAARPAVEMSERFRDIDTGAAGLDLKSTSMVGGAWIIGIALMSVRLFRQWTGVRKLRVVGVSEPSTTWTRTFDTLKSKIGVHPRIRMLVSKTIDAPMVVGWLRPLVLVPATAFTSLTPDQLQTILAHELQHIARRDHLVNMLQAFIEVLLFFHPVTWWLSRQIRAEREICCDDGALLVTGSPRTFAEALLVLESLRAGRTTSPRLLTATGGSLMHRVSRLFGSNQPQPLNAGWRAVSACTLLAVAGLTFATATTDPTAVAQDRRGVDAKQVDLDELRTNIEERVRAMGMNLRKQVVAGEITADEAKARFEEGEARMWERYRAAEAQNAEAGKSTLDYDAAVRKMTEMVEAGTITREQMQQRLEQMKDRMGASEESANTDDREQQRQNRIRYQAAFDELTEMVKDGKITRQQMEGRLEDIKDRMGVSRNSKAPSRAEYMEAEKKMAAMVKAGEITKEQMQQRLDRMKQDGSRKQRKTGKDGGRRMSRDDYDAAVKRMIEMVEDGTITREQMQQRLDRMKQADE